ncbi:MAG: DUF2163 domain-containing protein [Thiohalorhabdus sp.]|uniref:DUF2163 domain-containing protein n=1 Tax=Thiohalorhabdus sp. TaxID=3094134 RepID=UPI003980F435
MKDISPELKDHLAGEVTTLATCWRLELQDGTVLGFTDHDRDIDYDGTTYEASSGFDASAIATGADLAVDELEVDALLGGTGITEAEIAAGRYDHAEIEIFSINYEDKSQGRIIWRRGWLGEVQPRDGVATVEVRGLSQALKQTIGETYTPACRADLGDSRCGVDLDALRVTGEATAVTDQATFSDSGRSESEGYFDYGVVTWTSGDNEGLRMEIKGFDGEQFVLFEPMPYPIATGDTYEATPGCDKRLETCRDQYDNVINFRGEPYIPGSQEISRIGGLGG